MNSNTHIQKYLNMTTQMIVPKLWKKTLEKEESELEILPE